MTTATSSHLRTSFECLRNLNESLRMFSQLEKAPWHRGQTRDFLTRRLLHYFIAQIVQRSKVNFRGGSLKKFTLAFLCFLTSSHGSRDGRFSIRAAMFFLLPLVTPNRRRYGSAVNGIIINTNCTQQFVTFRQPRCFIQHSL